MVAQHFDGVVDSGARRDFGTGSVRDVADGKGRFDLLPFYPIERIAQHFENGARKYGDRNWQKGQPLHVYLDSGLRHTFKLLDGWSDEDHAAAAAWNLLAYMWTAREIAEGRLPRSLDTLGHVAPPAVPGEPFTRAVENEPPCCSGGTQAEVCRGCSGAVPS